MKKIIAVLALMSLFGCGRSEATKEEYQRADEYSIQHPTYIGTLPNGQRIGRILLKNTPNEYDHYVYFTDNVKTSNTDYTTGSGRNQSTHHEVYVQINGQSVPLEQLKQTVQEAEAVNSKLQQ